MPLGRSPAWGSEPLHQGWTQATKGFDLSEVVLTQGGQVPLGLESAPVAVTM